MSSWHGIDEIDEVDKMVYLIALMISGMLAIFWQIQNGKEKNVYSLKIGNYIIRANKNLFALFAILPIYLIYSLQYSLHTDYDNYEKAFWSIKSGNGRIREIAINYINKGVAYLDLDFQFVYIIIYLIAFSILVKCIKEYSEDYSFSLMLFVMLFFVLGFLQIRQLVAVVICSYAYRYIDKKYFFRYMCLIILATLFHVSALIMIPAYFLLIYNFKASYFLIVSMIFSAISLKKEAVLIFLVKHFMPSYLHRHELFRNQIINKWDAIFILLIVFICILYDKMIRKKPMVNVKFLNALYIYTVIFFLGRWILEFDRFGYYFYFPVIFLIPNAIQSERNVYFRILLKSIVIFSAIIIFWIKYHNSELFHYVSILSK